MGMRGPNQRRWASLDLIIIIIVVVLHLRSGWKIKNILLLLSKVSRPRTRKTLTNHIQDSGQVLCEPVLQSKAHCLQSFQVGSELLSTTETSSGANHATSRPHLDFPSV